MKKIRQNWLITAVLLSALLLRLPLLNGSLWLDEAGQALESIRPLSQQLDIIPDFQPPLLHFLVRFVMYFSTAEWWLRLTTAMIPGLVSIWATYAIGKRLMSPKVGAVAALLLTTSSLHIFYSQELRPYALPLMWAMLSWLWLIRLNQSEDKNKSRSWLVWSLLTLLGLFSSYLYPFLVIAQAVWVSWQMRSHLKHLALSCGLAGVGFLPWIPMFLKQLAAGNQVRQELPGWDQVVSLTQLKSIPLVLGKFVFGIINLQLDAGFGLATLALLGLGLSTIYFLVKVDKSKKIISILMMVLIWLVVPLVTSWVVSFWVPVIQPKRVLYLLPAFYLLITISLFQVNRKWLTTGLIGLLLVFNLFGIWQYWTQARYQRENWRDLISTIEKRYPAHQTIALFTFPEPYAPWRWYAQPEIKTLSTGTLHVQGAGNLNQKLKPITAYSYVVVFDYLRDLSDPEDQILREVEAFGYETIDLLDYPGIGFVRIYARRPGTLGLAL